MKVDISVVGSTDDTSTVRRMGDARMIGDMPETSGFSGGLHVRVEGTLTTVRDSATDALVVQGRGFAKTMQALADALGVPVTVENDFGVTSPIPVGTWTPVEVVEVTPVTSTTEQSLAVLRSIDSEVIGGVVYGITACAGDTVYRDRDGATGTVRAVEHGGRVRFTLDNGTEYLRTVAELRDMGFTVITAAELSEIASAAEHPVSAMRPRSFRKVKNTRSARSRRGGK